MNDASCRILAVSTSLATSLDLVKRVEQLTSSGPPIPSTAPAAEDVESHIPWRLENKYYTANVHFLARQIKGLAPYHVQGVPAVIFAWTKGEAYKHNVDRLAKDIGGAEPEVSLAVRLPAIPNLAEADREDAEDASEETSVIDEFLSSHGFEFVDASASNAGTKEEDPEDGIPSLPRVLDALSTIMWPSMQTSQSNGKDSRRPDPKGAAFLEWAQLSFDASDVPDEPEQSSLSPASRPSRRMQNEMAELAKWLEEDEKEDPWKTANLSFSPPDMDGDGWGDHLKVRDDDKTPSGFDDDFSVFISAPPPESRDASHPPEHDASFDDVPFDVSFDSQRLGPTEDLMYHSLGSHSDLGDTSQDVPEDSLTDDEEDVEDEEGLPSQSEIRESAQRIFGHGMEQDVPSDDDDFDLAPFDISQVMSALQGMKAEIADIDNEAERRKAAARVALGLVYGLEKDSKEDPQP